ncbi:hypothetical protein A3850_003040 [Lewinella sp. 4G2]|nr:hypothetical protein A3850_003040 [Lewinella sp. 4G2]
MERERRQQQWFAIALMIAGLLGAIGGVVAGNILFPFVGAVVATLSLFWLYRILSEQPIAVLRRWLREEPERFAWVYTTHTERMPFGFKTQSQGTLYLVEPDGKTHSYSLEPKDLKLVGKTLNRVLPHAEFGYTEERDLRYRGEVTRVKGRGEGDLFF